MFTKFISLFVLVAPLVSALTISAPANAITGQTLVISYTRTSIDPTVLMVLLNNLQSGVNNVLITAVNLSSLAGNIDVVVPAVAPGNYAVEVASTLNGDILARSGEVTIAAA